jgi:lipoyl(octanoyl) transferase
MSRRITVWRLGRVEYEDGLRLQHLFGEARKADLVGDVLLLLEHSPVLTLGRAGKRSNIVASPQILARMGVGVFETNRGGDVTYHGPGQIVGYPIIKLPPERQDVRRYVRDVEESMIRTCAEYGLTAGRIPNWTGVWIGDEQSPDARKIGAIGVHIARWQTSHGFAFNVNTDLSHFGLIVPCGIQQKGVTSLSLELGRAVPLPEVEDRLARHFGELFGSELREMTPERKTISVAVTRGEGGRTEVLLLKRRPERGGFWQIITGRVEPSESAHAAATREVAEETGQELAAESLDYVHSFALGDESPPLIVEETAFAARWPDGAAVRVDPSEHVEWAWCSPAEALARLPYAGLKVAVRRAVEGLSRAA